MRITKLAKFVCTLTIVVSMVISTLGASVAHAQSNPDGSSSTRAGGPRRQLATILFAGLGGAVLGLSTLSFYGRPQDKLSNIALGFAGGVILGTVVVTYRAATNPNEFYGAQLQIENEQLSTNKMAQSFQTAPQFAFNFEF